MKSRTAFTLLELCICLLLGLILLSMFYIVFRRTDTGHKGVKSQNAARSIGLTLVAYAEDDIRNFKMPYPLPYGKEKVWGNSKDCWTTSIVEMLLRQKYFRKGDEAQFFSTREHLSPQYKPMVLSDNTEYKNTYWNKNCEIDFQIYCDKELTSNVSGKMVLVATYDNENIKDCQFQGKGWIVFYADKTTEFIKRKKLDEYVPPISSVNYVEGTNLDKSIILRKNIPVSEGGPGAFGNYFGGGSTELMGKRDSDAIYKALVK